jgi:hypothetical protein
MCKKNARGREAYPLDDVNGVAHTSCAPSTLTLNVFGACFLCIYLGLMRIHA